MSKVPKYAGRTLDGILVSWNFTKKCSKKIMHYCRIPQYQIPNVLPENTYVDSQQKCKERPIFLTRKKTHLQSKASMAQ